MLHGPITSLERLAPDAVAAGATAGMGSILPVASRGLTFARGGRQLLAGIDLGISGAGITMIMGPNGAGKSLLLRVLAGLIEPDSGTVSWNGGAPDRARAHRLAFVFQHPVLLRRSVLANMLHALKATGVPRIDRSRRALAALEQGGLGHLAKSPARVLSGGEQQRLALVRALAARPQLLFLDEPTASLDPTSTAAIETLVLDAAAAGTRILFVSHDVGQARRLADDVLFLCDGRITETSPAETFFDQAASPQAKSFLEGRLLL